MLQGARTSLLSASQASTMRQIPHIPSNGRQHAFCNGRQTVEVRACAKDALKVSACLKSAYKTFQNKTDGWPIIHFAPCIPASSLRRRKCSSRCAASGFDCACGMPPGLHLQRERHFYRQYCCVNLEHKSLGAY
eukprot:491548-Pelagomonas_calceolata.AAC.3